MFGTLQDRLIKELAQLGIGDIETANKWMREVHLPRHNRRFAGRRRWPRAPREGPDQDTLVEALCIQEARVVERGNTVTLKLQLPDSPLRHHWVKARVRIYQYPDDTLALFLGPCCIARYDAQGAASTPHLERRPCEAVLGTATRLPGKGPSSRGHLAPAARDGTCARPRTARLIPCHHRPSTASGSGSWFLTRSGQVMRHKNRTT